MVIGAVCDQAKATWPIAYDKGFADAEAISTQMAYEAGKEQGRKEERAEVVEWINKELWGGRQNEPRWGSRQMTSETWQAKLKEWEEK